MYIISTSDGTCIEIKSDVYTITNGETNIITDAHGFDNWLLWWGCRQMKTIPDYLKKYKNFSFHLLTYTLNGGIM